MLASDGEAPAPRRPAARTTFQYARLGRRGPCPATSCGSHDVSICSPRTAGPLPRDVLRLALPGTACHRRSRRPESGWRSRR